MASEEKTEKSSPTTSGPDSDIGSVKELPQDEETGVAQTSDLSNKVNAGANYLGSFFSSAWTKTTKTANDATTSSSTFLSTALGKVGGSTANSSAANSSKNSPKIEENPIVENPDTSSDDPNADQGAVEVSSTSSSAATSFFNSAWSKVGDFTKTNITGTAATKETETDSEPVKDEDKTEDDGESGKKGSSFLSNISNMVGKVANNAGTVIKDKVSGTSMIAEFNKEQEEFIKNKGPDCENGLPPWIGYQEEEALKNKILSLSKDKRNFVRAPPSGVTFEFEYSNVSAVAMALLQEDPELEKMRYELVPKQVKEEEFWRNYFYRVNLIKQSFDLKDLESSQTANGVKPSAKETVKEISNNDEDVNNLPSQDHDDDEFVSDSYQASSADIDEVNASMKTLGVKGKENADLEAELEGELNEFEMVSSKADEDSNDPEWENQIQQMLDAEENN